MAAATFINTKRVYIGPVACIHGTLVSGGTADTFRMPIPAAGADTAAAKHRAFGLTSSPINDSAGTAHLTVAGIDNGNLEIAVAGGVVNDRNLVRIFTW